MLSILQFTFVVKSAVLPVPMAFSLSPTRSLFITGVDSEPVTRVVLTINLLLVFVSFS